MKPVIVKLYEGEPKIGCQRIVINKNAFYLQGLFKSRSIIANFLGASSFEWLYKNEIDFPEKYLPAIIEALKKVGKK